MCSKVNKIGKISLFERVYMALKIRIWGYCNRYKFKGLGHASFINCPLRIDGIDNIIIENDVIIEYKSWLAAVPHTGFASCLLKIGNGTRIGHFNHIYATREIIIEDYVLIADKVYISDNLHSYKNPLVPILQQEIEQKQNVRIGHGAWIGENSVIIGAKIGKHSVVGANSVVTHDVPDYCVVAGAPAKIIKKYNFDEGIWEKIS